MRSKVQATWRLAKLWTTGNKRLSLHGLKMKNTATGDFVIAREPKSVCQGLSAAWSPVFAHKTVDEVKARVFLSQSAGGYIGVMCQFFCYRFDLVPEKSKTFWTQRLILQAVPMDRLTQLGSLLALQVQRGSSLFSRTSWMTSQ